jgi:hypothetical protein
MAEPSQPAPRFVARIGWLLIPILPLAIVLAARATRWIALKHLESLAHPPGEISGLLYDLGVQHELARERNSPSARSASEKS